VARSPRSAKSGTSSPKAPPRPAQQRADRGPFRRHRGHDAAALACPRSARGRADPCRPGAGGAGPRACACGPVAAAAEPAPAPVAPEEADDLTRIKGLGPKLKTLLAGLGITRFAQIAAWTEADLAAIDPKLGAFAGRPARDNWIEQARLLSSGDTGAYEDKFGKL
jgi:predicted flap endonuclease-1-like 5' DNA nuclease